MTWACTETSSAETGSSATTSSGLTDSALAMPMRWRWPPENSCGYFFSAAAGRPTSESSCVSRGAASFASLTIPCACMPSTRSDSTLCRGSRLPMGSWKTICRSWRRRRSASPRRSVSASPSKVTVPSVISSSARIARPIVDLPQPDSPTSP